MPTGDTTRFPFKSFDADHAYYFRSEPDVKCHWMQNTTPSLAILQHPNGIRFCVDRLTGRYLTAGESPFDVVEQEPIAVEAPQPIIAKPEQPPFTPGQRVRTNDGRVLDVSRCEKRHVPSKLRWVVDDLNGERAFADECELYEGVKPEVRYACTKLAAVGDTVKVIGSNPPLHMKVEEVSPTGGLYIKSPTGTACMLLNSSQVEFVPEIPPAATKWPRYFESKDARHDKSLRRVYHADGTCGWQDGNGSPMSTTLSEALQDDYMIETDADGNELKQQVELTNEQAERIMANAMKQQTCETCGGEFDTDGWCKCDHAKINALPKPEASGVERFQSAFAETKPVVAKYRSKPCVIEAIHYKGTKDSFDAIYDWMDGDNVGSANLGYRGPSEHDPQEFGIKTLKGSMIATPGDWIIKGTHGEFYACKPEVFAVKYELVEATQPIPGEVAKVEHDHDQELAADHDAAIANAQAVTRENLAIIAAKDAEIAELRKQVESLECEVYCPTCGGCGCEGCCSPNNCQIVKCKYPHNVETWEENMKAIEDATKRAERAEAEAGILADNLTLREQEIAEAKDELSICKNGNAILDTQNEQLRTKLAEVEKERDEANRTVNIVLSSLHWTGDGYEWTGGQYDYRMTPADALAATQGMLHQLRSAKKELTAQLAAANERVADYRKQIEARDLFETDRDKHIAALTKERDGLREVLEIAKDACEKNLCYAHYKDEQSLYKTLAIIKKRLSQKEGGK